jgi:N-acetylmuramoyl-L-alanine amidase
MRFTRFAFLAGALILASSVLPASAARFSTVVIDAGHGGHDRGGIPGQRASEKAATLDVSFRLRRILNNSGIRTVMTRTDDSFISLGRRVAIANSQRNAVFVSVHFNSAKREGARGFETYYYSSRSASLASAIHRRMVKQTWRTEDRGLRRRGFYVIRKTRIPSVLVEGGFLTNRDEARTISKPEYRQRLAMAIASGILSSR